MRRNLDKPITEAARTGQIISARGIEGTIESARRAMRACEMRSEGYDFNEIAAELGYADRSGAWRAVRRTIAKLPTPAAKALRATQIDELLEIQRAHFPHAIGMIEGSPIIGMDGLEALPSKDSAEVHLKAGKRIAELYGLDQPKSLRVEMDRQMNQLLDRLKKELPSDVYEQVLAIASADDGEGETDGDSDEAAEGSTSEETEGS